MREEADHGYSTYKYTYVNSLPPTWEPLGRKHKVYTSLKGRRKQNWKGWEGSFPRHPKGSEQWWRVRGEVQKRYFHICRGSLTPLAGTASHCIVRDDGCLEDASMEVWGRSALPDPGFGSDRQEVKGLSGAEAVWGACADLTIVLVHACMHSAVSCLQCSFYFELALDSMVPVLTLSEKALVASVFSC